MKVTTGLLRGLISNSCDHHPFPPNWGLQLRSQNLILQNCGQTVLDITVVCIDSLWEHTIAILNSTVIDPLEVPLLQKTGSQKINSNLMQKSQQISKALYEPPIPTYIGAPLPLYSGKLTCRASAAS